MSEVPGSDRGRVLVVQRRLTHYRVPFFERLRTALAAQGMPLTLVVGEPTAAERSRHDVGHLDWARPVPCRFGAGERFNWMALGPWVAQADQVVLAQETRQLHNLPLLLRPGRCRVALWGHGRDLQAHAGPVADVAQALKATLTRRADWWFAYTAMSAAILRGLGCPADRITTVDNAIDTAGLVATVVQARANGASALRRACGLGDGPVGLFLGSLTAERRLDLLWDAVCELRRAVPDFQLVVAGDGPQAALLRERVAGQPWAHAVGALHGPRKAQFIAAADVMIGPAAMGLGLLEAMACAVPLVTSSAPGHGPEMAYLVDGQNGLVASPQPAALAQAVLAVLQQPGLAERLREGGLATAREHSLDAMVQRFASGLATWRASPRREGV